MIVSTDTQTVTVRTDMSNDEYHGERDHISRSTAHRYFGEEGGPCQLFVDTYGESLFSGNSATSFGSLVDLACECEMSGRNWRSAVVVPPPGVLAADGSRRGKAYQEWRAASVSADGCECSQSDFDKVEKIIASLRRHDAANRLLESASHSQLSVFWTDEHGHRRKARADGAVGQEHWFDLKTTSSEWRDLKYSFRRFGYDWQAAWYAEAARVAGFSRPDFFPFVCVQTHAPYRVKVLTLTQPVIDRAVSEIKATLDDIVRRRETGEYLTPEYHAISELDF
jgi:hypothetical protein